ncbi:MAG: DNRLRE domain-containing protein [Dysgonomonas sp.]
MKKIFFTLIASFFCLSNVFAQTTSHLTASDDVYIYGDVGDKDVSRGSEDILRSYYNDGATSREMVFLKFDLSSLSSVDVSKILSVKLRLYGTADAGGGNSTPTTHNLCVFNMTATNPTFSWTETSLGYNAWFGNGVNSSTVGEGNSGSSNAYFFRRNPHVTSSNNNGKAEYLIAKLDNIAAGTSWYEWDVTSTIKSALSSSSANISLQVCDELNVRKAGGSDRAYVIFHSKENVSGNAPELLLSFDITNGIESVENQAVAYTLKEKNLSISNITTSTTISIMDLSGKKIHKAIVSGDYSYSFAHSGIYLISISNNQGTKTHKVFVR